MSDYIKREDALNAFRRVYMIPGRGTAKEIYTKQIENTYKDIEAIPAADVIEQKHGKWMPIYDGNEFGEVYQSGVYCSECDEELQSEPNYCPNCGARMDGDS